MKTINVSYINEAYYIVINGDIEFNESDLLLDLINNNMSKKNSKIVIDLGNCKYIDSLGLSAIKQSYEIAKKHQKTLMICNLDKDCEDILYMTTLWSKVPVLKNLSSCLQDA